MDDLLSNQVPTAFCLDAFGGKLNELPTVGLFDADAHLCDAAALGRRRLRAGLYRLFCFRIVGFPCAKTPPGPSPFGNPGAATGDK